MKFHWFHLMPYRYLPPDFPERYRSVWVDIPSDLYDPVKGHHLYNEYLDELEHADALGFDGICVNEHHQNAYGLMPSPNLMASALTRRTQHSAIVVLGNSIALYYPPVRVAEEFAMLDVLSGGRLVAGFPLGTAMDTTYAYGIPPIELRERYDEAHDLIMQAWTRREPFAFNGKFTKLRYVNIWPRPLQQPHPPIWVPGSGSVETWEWIAPKDYVYCYLSFFGYKRGMQIFEGFWDTVARVGGSMNPNRAGFLQLVALSETDEQAERDYAEHASYFFNTCLHWYRGFTDAPGYQSMRTIQATGGSSLLNTGRGPRPPSTWSDLVKSGAVIAGSPATVREQLLEATKQMRVGQLLLLLHFGSMPRELTMKNSELFAREVAPYFRNLFSESPDDWAPRPLADGQMSPPMSSEMTSRGPR